MVDEFVDWKLVDDGLDNGKVGVDKARLYRLKKWGDARTGKSGRNFEFAVSLIGKFGGVLGVDECVYLKSIEVYSDCVDEGVLRGRSVEVLVAVSLYVGCRLCHNAFSVDEIVESMGLRKKEVNRVFRVVKKKLGLKLPLVKSVDYVSRFGGVLKLGDDVCERVVEVLEFADSNGLGNGRNPLGLVGGAFYLACDEFGVKKSQRDISDVLGVSEVTVRNRYFELCGLLGL